MQPRPPAELDPLLPQLPFVRRLARALVVEPADADDLSQDVAVVALARGPPLAEMRPWLAGVTRNLARLLQRGEERRARRERAAARSEPVPSSHDDAARLESLRRVVAALERLDADDRALVLRRYYDGWPPRRIAAELAIPVNTVRSRVQRALARMRRDLGVADPQERTRLLAPLLVTGGGGIVATKVKVGVAAGLVALLAIAAVQLGRSTRGRSARASSPSPSVAIVEPSPSAAAPDRVAELAAVEPAPGPIEASAPVRSVALSGRLVGDLGRIARWSTPLVVVPSIELLEDDRIAVPPVPERFTRSVRVAPDGTFAASIALDALSPPIARLTLKGRDPLFAPFERRLAIHASSHPEAVIPWEIDVPVFASADVTGCVVDESGAPIAQAAVGLFRAVGAAGRPAIAEALTNERGEFSIGVAGSGPHRVVATTRRIDPTWSLADRKAPPRALLPVWTEVDVARHEEIDVGDLVLREGVAIRGRVVWVGRGPAAGAAVSARRAEAAESSTFFFGQLVRSVQASNGEPLSGVALTDERGEFELGGLTPGAWLVQVNGCAEGSLAADVAERTRVAVDAPKADVVLRLELAWVEFQCLEGETPIPAARVIVATRSETMSCSTTAFRPGRLGTDEQGLTGMPLPPGMTTTWFAHARGFARRNGTLTTPAVGERMLVPIRFEREQHVPSLEVVIRGPHGESISRAGILVAEAGVEGHGGDYLATNGRFVVRDLAPGRYVVRVRPGGAYDAGDGCYEELEREVEITGGAVARLELDAMPAARLRVSAHDPDGALLPARFELFDESGATVEVIPRALIETERGGFQSSHRKSDGLAPEGPCMCDPPLPGGRYRARFTMPGFEEVAVSVLLEDGRCTDLAVVMARAVGRGRSR